MGLLTSSRTSSVHQQVLCLNNGGRPTRIATVCQVQLAPLPVDPTHYQVVSG